MTGPRTWLLLAVLRLVAVVERNHGRRTRAWNADHHSAVTTRPLEYITPREYHDRISAAVWAVDRAMYRNTADKATQERFSATPEPETHSETPDPLTGRQAATQRWRNG